MIYYKKQQSRKKHKAYFIYGHSLDNAVIFFARMNKERRNCDQAALSMWCVNCEIPPSYI